MPDIVLCIVIGYLCGCFLTAEVVMRVRTGLSAFEVGSGNPGMANVGAQLGTGWAAVVLAGDIVKTIAAVALAAMVCSTLGDTTALTNAAECRGAVSSLESGSSLLQALVPWPWAVGFPHSGTACTLLAGFGAVIGHDFPFWHRFRGGKGVTTTCSAIILFSPLLGGLASLVGLAVVAATHKLDVGALVIPAAFLAGSFLIGAPLGVPLYGAGILAVSIAVWLRGRSGTRSR